jgi:O-antigen ligase
MRVPASALLLWAGLWLNLNTGEWNIHRPGSLGELTTLVRALLPFVVLPIALIILVESRARRAAPGLAPSRCLLLYGVISLLSSAFSADPWSALYWAVTFLATLLTISICATADQHVDASRHMLQITWAVTLVVAALIAHMGRGLIFGSAASAYGIMADLNELSRSSGVARWAAVPGLVCLLKAYHARRPGRIAVFLAAAGGAFFLVYRMQSRGAVFGCVAALIFALITASRLRRFALPLLVFAVVVLAALESPGMLSGRVSEYLRRGETEEQFRTMTGRTRAYQHGLGAFWEAPLFGRGQRADRLIIGEHVHNSYLQALLNAGILGGVPYMASWVAGWVLFFRVQKKRHLLRPEDRLALLEAGTVMMFFTVRSIPETTTASFAVDLLVMAAVYVYIEALAVSTARRSLGRPARIPLRASTPRNLSCPQVVNGPELIAAGSRR